MKTQWKPIDTAPRDGRKIFLYHPTRGKDVIRGYFKSGWFNASGYRLLWSPTHWIEVEALEGR